MSGFISLSDAKLQLNMLPEENSDDALIETLIVTASETVESDLNRTVYLTEDALNTDENAPASAIVVNNRIKMATKLLLTHWYNNREASSEMTVKVVPLAYEHLINGLRKSAGC